MEAQSKLLIGGKLHFYSVCVYVYRRAQHRTLKTTVQPPDVMLRGRSQQDRFFPTQTLNKSHYDNIHPDKTKGFSESCGLGTGFSVLKGRKSSQKPKSYLEFLGMTIIKFLRCKGLCPINQISAASVRNQQRKLIHSSCKICKKCSLFPISLKDENIFSILS